MKKAKKFLAVFLTLAHVFALFPISLVTVNAAAVGTQAKTPNPLAGPDSTDSTSSELAITFFQVDNKPKAQARVNQIH